MRISTVFVCAMLLSIVAFAPPNTVTSGVDYTNPGNVNKLFGNFTTPVIKPGESGILNFTIRNYYSTPVYNITLQIEIYFYATIESGRYVDSKFTNPPRFRISDELLATLSWSDWRIYANQPYNQYYATLGIATQKNTPEGTYFVRFTLTFYDPLGNLHILKSRGCFTNEEWKSATTNVSDFDMSAHGGVNITRLGVDGILPDTSFSVSSGPNLIPFFVLIVLAGATGTLSVMYYLNETRGMFPWLEHITYRWKGKFYQLRALFKHRLKKK
ncbi:MAG: hypothetical protein ACP5LE_00240 [Thermoplasmata archaeon]